MASSTAHSNGNPYLSRVGIQWCVLFILPKLQTHKKAGNTVNLKNPRPASNADKTGAHIRKGTLSVAATIIRSDRKQGQGAERLNVPYFGGLFNCPSPWLGPWTIWLAGPDRNQKFGAGEEGIRSGNGGTRAICRMCPDLTDRPYGNPDGTLPGPVTAIGNATSARRWCDAGEGNGPMHPDPLPGGLMSLAAPPR